METKTRMYICETRPHSEGSQFLLRQISFMYEVLSKYLCSLLGTDEVSRE